MRASIAFTLFFASALVATAARATAPLRRTGMRQPLPGTASKQAFRRQRGRGKRW